MKIHKQQSLMQLGYHDHHIRKECRLCRRISAITFGVAKGVYIVFCPCRYIKKGMSKVGIVEAGTKERRYLPIHRVNQCVEPKDGRVYLTIQCDVLFAFVGSGWAIVSPRGGLLFQE